MQSPFVTVKFLGRLVDLFLSSEVYLNYKQKLGDLICSDSADNRLVSVKMTRVDVDKRIELWSSIFCKNNFFSELGHNHLCYL